MKTNGQSRQEHAAKAVASNEPRAWLSVVSDIGWLLFFLLLFASLAMVLGPDGTPDFKIYHFYNGYAENVDRSELDIFAAQLQTTFFPVVDSIYYNLTIQLNDNPLLLGAILSIPNALSAFFIYMLIRNFIPVDIFGRRIVAAAAAVLGLTGASALPTLATTMSDIVPGVFVVAAITWWLTLELKERNTLATAAIIGGLAGVSVALKLTQVPIFVGFFVAIMVRNPRNIQQSFWEAFLFGAMGVLVFFFIDGPWLLGNWIHFGNPVFPMMNNIFQSDLVASAPWTDLRFMPKTIIMALFYPFYWGFSISHDAIELNMRDPRIAIGCISALFILGMSIYRFARDRENTHATPFHRASISLALMFLISYVLWERLWSIYRYLAVQETLSAVLFVIAVIQIFDLMRLGRKVLLLPVTLVIAFAMMASTAYPWWSRAQRGPQAIQVTLPAIESNAMVLFLDPYAYSYLVPFMPEGVRAVGANTNLVRPGSVGTLWPHIESTVNSFSGPLWGFEFPKAFPNVADNTLSSLGIRRAKDCTTLVNNIEEQGTNIMICRLEKM